MPSARAAGASAFEWQEEIGVNQARRTGPVAEPVLALAAAAPAAQNAAPTGPAESADDKRLELGFSDPAGAGPGASSNGIMHGGSASVSGGNGAAAMASAAAPVSEAAAELERRCKRKKKDREKGKAVESVAA